MAEPKPTDQPPVRPVPRGSIPGIVGGGGDGGGGSPYASGLAAAASGGRGATSSEPSTSPTIGPRTMIAALEDWKARDAEEVDQFLALLREFCSHRRANLERFERLMGIK